jgi:putative intracellular protease/amidase
MLIAAALLTASTASAQYPQPLRAYAHNDPNPVDARRPKRVAIVIANPSVNALGQPVGFWWSELTHPYFLFAEQGYQVEIFSYFGGKAVADGYSNPGDPSRWQSEDLISSGFMVNPELVKLVETTRPAKEIDVDRFDAIVIAGGQAPMVTIEKAIDTQKKFVEFYEKGKVAAALCHGSAILRYAKLSSGEYLVKGKTVTGFANVEEDFGRDAGVKYGFLKPGQELFTWRIETELKKLGANFIQAGLWRSFAVRDGNLVTGQQNYSGGETARLVIAALGG